MKEIIISELTPENSSGLLVQLPESGEVYREDYFYWKGSKQHLTFQSDSIITGQLKTWHREPVFKKLEYHEDYEKFVFVSGNALFPIALMKEGRLCENTFCVYRILPGTEIVIPPGIAHFMPVAESDEPVCAVVVCPKMPFYHVYLEDEVKAVKGK